MFYIPRICLSAYTVCHEFRLTKQKKFVLLLYQAYLFEVKIVEIKALQNWKISVKALSKWLWE
jgi:hypothetical protein